MKVNVTKTFSIHYNGLTDYGKAKGILDIMTRLKAKDHYAKFEMVSEKEVRFTYHEVEEL